MLRILVCAVVAVALVGCAADESTVPNVVGERLDLAQSHVEDAGLEYEEIGGGTFGVIDASGWVVCSQEPAPGASTEGVVKLVVDRSCGEQPEDVAAQNSSTGSSDSAAASKKSGGGGGRKNRARFRAAIHDVAPINSNAVLVSWTVTNVGKGAGPATCRIKIETDDEGFFNNDAAQYETVGRIDAGDARSGTTRVTGLSAEYVVDASMLCG